MLTASAGILHQREGSAAPVSGHLPEARPRSPDVQPSAAERGGSLAAPEAQVLIQHLQGVQPCAPPDRLPPQGVRRHPLSGDRLRATRRQEALFQADRDTQEAAHLPTGAVPQANT